MKIYCVDYYSSTLNTNTIYVSKYSTFKIGIKVDDSNTNVKLYDGATEISSEANPFNGYVLFKITAQDSGRKLYFVKKGNILFDLILVKTESTVAELDSSSGSSSPTQYASKIEIFGTTLSLGVFSYELWPTGIVFDDYPGTTHTCIYCLGIGRKDSTPITEGATLKIVLFNHYDVKLQDIDLDWITGKVDSVYYTNDTEVMVDQLQGFQITWKDLDNIQK